MKPKSKIEHLRTLVEGVKKIPIKSRANGDHSDSRLNESSFEFNPHDASNVQSDFGDNYNKILDASAFETHTLNGRMYNDMMEDQMLRNLDEPETGELVGASTLTNKDTTDQQVISEGRKSANGQAAEEHDGVQEQKVTHSEHGEANHKILNDDVSESSLHKPKSRVSGKKLPAVLPPSRTKLPMRSKPKLVAAKPPGLPDFSLKPTHDTHHEEGHKPEEIKDVEQKIAADEKVDVMEEKIEDKPGYKNDDKPAVEEQIEKHDVSNADNNLNGKIESNGEELIAAENDVTVPPPPTPIRIPVQTDMIIPTPVTVPTPTQVPMPLIEQKVADNDHKIVAPELKTERKITPNVDTPRDQQAFDFAPESTTNNTHQQLVEPEKRTIGRSTTNNVADFVQLKNTIIDLQRELKETKHELDNYKRVCDKYVHAESTAVNNNQTSDEYENTIYSLKEENEKLKEALAQSNTERPVMPVDVKSDTDYEALIDELKAYYNKLFHDNNVIIQDKESQIVKLVAQNKQLLQEQRQNGTHTQDTEGLSTILQEKFEELDNADGARIERMLEGIKTLEIESSGWDVDIDVDNDVTINIVGAHDDILKKAFEFIENNKFELTLPSRAQVYGSIVNHMNIADIDDHKNVTEDKIEEKEEENDDEDINIQEELDKMDTYQAPLIEPQFEHKEPEVQDVEAAAYNYKQNEVIQPDNEQEAIVQPENEQKEEEQPEDKQEEVAQFEHKTDHKEVVEQFNDDIAQQYQIIDDNISELPIPVVHQSDPVQNMPIVEQPHTANEVLMPEQSPPQAYENVPTDDKLATPVKQPAEPSIPEPIYTEEIAQKDENLSILDQVSTVVVDDLKLDNKDQTIVKEIKVEPKKFKPLLKRKLKVTQMGTDTGLFGDEDHDSKSIKFNDNISVTFSEKKPSSAVKEKPVEPVERKVTNIFTQARVARPLPRPVAK